eukprot:2627437-Pleurochrysis_carterae.AAC.1
MIFAAIPPCTHTSKKISSTTATMATGTTIAIITTHGRKPLTPLYSKTVHIHDGHADVQRIARHISGLRALLISAGSCP